jgi:hypothetical protein
MTKLEVSPKSQPIIQDSSKSMIDRLFVLDLISSNKMLMLQISRYFTCTTIMASSRDIYHIFY